MHHRRVGVVQGYFPVGVRRAAQAVQAAPAVHGPRLPSPQGSSVPLPPQAARLQPPGGQPLPPAVLQRMEAQFGTTFHDVRIHVGGEAAAIGAVAFTHGSHIHFAPGQYNLSTPQGQHILARELAHVVQQRAGRVRNPFGSGVAVVQDKRLEMEAERMARQAVQSARVAQPRMAVPPQPRRAQVVQANGTWHSVGANADYVLRRGTSRGRKTLSLAASNAPATPLAEMEYDFDDTTAYMLHVEAYGMPGGTRAGYLLFYHFASDALQSGKLLVAIGTGVDRASATRNLATATRDNDQSGINTANSNLAAVHIYESLGFDAADAVRLSRSVVPTRDVFTVAHAKMRTHWSPATTPAVATSSASSSKCFLTTACVEWRGLPDDCEELTVLRRFRDSYVRTVPGGGAMIEHYYAVAPDLVAAIQTSSERGVLLESIYRVVRFCVGAVERGEREAALEAYRSMVTALASR